MELLRKKILPKFRSENDIELHVKEVRTSGDKRKVKTIQSSLSDFDTSKKELLEEVKSAYYHDLEDLVFRMGLTFGEILNILNIKNFSSERTGYSLPTGIYEIININKTLEFLLPDIVKVSITIDDIRLGSI